MESCRDTRHAASGAQLFQVSSVLSEREEKEAWRGMALLLVTAKTVEGVMLRFVQVGFGGGLVTFLMFGVGNSIILKFLTYFVYGVGCIHGAVYGGQKTTCHLRNMCVLDQTQAIRPSSKHLYPQGCLTSP